VFVAVCVQAMPFLVLGVLLSGAIAAFVPPSALRRALPARVGAAVPVAGAAGLALPGCECASVPVARRLIAQGVPDSAALTFLLAAPAVNPVVLVSTAVAFPGEPGMVGARFAASLATACVMGWLWQRAGRAAWIAERARRAVPAAGGRGWPVFAETARHDLVAAGGFLVLGALVTATLAVLVPPAWTVALAGRMVLAVAVLAVLAVVRLIRPHREHADRPLVVFNHMLAEIDERRRDLSGDMVPDGLGERDPAGRRQRLQAGGDVHALSVEVAAIHDDVAEIDTDAVADPLRLAPVQIGPRHGFLNRQRAAHRGHHAAEFNQRAVAHELDDAPAMLLDLRQDQRAPVGLKPFQRSGLILLHQSRITDHVGR
jgi:hypothetical protein